MRYFGLVVLFHAIAIVTGDGGIGWDDSLPGPDGCSSEPPLVRNETGIPSGFVVTTCEGGRVCLKCPENSYVQIRAAAYGAEPLVCGNPANDRCEPANVLQKVNEFCKFTNDQRRDCAGFSCKLSNGQRTTCENIPADNSLFADPCSFKKKYLKVEYECL